MGLFDNIDDPTAGAPNDFSFLQQPPQAAPDATVAPPEAASGGLLSGPAAGPPPEAEAPEGGGLRGLLARVTAPDPSGLTFGDKLFAVGSSLKGDTAAVGRYLNTRNAALVKQKADATKQALAKAASQVLADNTDANGAVNIQGLVKGYAALNM